MKFMIAGLGSIGRRHYRNLRALGEQDILFYRTHRATLPEGELAGVPVETDLSRALEQKPDAVIIANPTAKHLEVAIPAAASGCDLLIEKPVSPSMDGIDALQAALQRGGGKAQVGYHFRFHPGLLRIRSLLAQQAIGSLVSARAEWGEFLPGWHPWEDYHLSYAARPDLGGGVVLTLSHPLDYLHWLLGEVEELWSFTSRLGLGLQVEDCAEIGLRFTSGVLGSVHLDYLQRPGRHSLEIIGTQGSLTWENTDGTVHLVQSGPEGAADSSQLYPAPTGFERNTLFLDEMRNFRDVVVGQAEPACSLGEGIYALQLALAVLRSGQQAAVQKVGGRPPVA
jgi:predicted dehydrogenase